MILIDVVATVNEHIRKRNSQPPYDYTLIGATTSTVEIVLEFQTGMLVCNDDGSVSGTPVVKLVGCPLVDVIALNGSTVQNRTFQIMFTLGEALDMEVNSVYDSYRGGVNNIITFNQHYTFSYDDIFKQTPNKPHPMSFSEFMRMQAEKFCTCGGKM